MSFISGRECARRLAQELPQAYTASTLGGDSAHRVTLPRLRGTHQSGYGRMADKKHAVEEPLLIRHMVVVRVRPGAGWSQIDVAVGQYILSGALHHTAFII